MSDGTWTTRTKPDGTIIAERDGYNPVTLTLEPGAQAIEVDAGWSSNECGHSYVGELPWSALAPLIADAVARGVLRLPGVEAYRPAPRNERHVTDIPGPSGGLMVVDGHGRMVDEAESGPAPDPLVFRHGEPIRRRAPVTDAPPPTGTIFLPTGGTEAFTFDTREVPPDVLARAVAEASRRKLVRVAGEVTAVHDGGNAFEVMPGACVKCPFAHEDDDGYDCVAGDVPADEVTAAVLGHLPAPALCPLRDGPITVRLATPE